MVISEKHKSNSLGDLEGAVQLLYSLRDDKDLGLASLICLQHAFKTSLTCGNKKS